MKKILIILFVFISFISYSQQPFYGNRRFVNYSGTDTLYLTFLDDSLLFSTEDTLVFDADQYWLGQNFKWNDTTLNIISEVGNYNLFIGNNSGTDITIGDYNTFLGIGSGAVNTEGYYNTLIGKGTGAANLVGDYNTYIGAEAGNKNIYNQNTMIGYRAGINNVNGSSNVFIGYLAGSNETGSNKLYIENSNSLNPLIYGDFTNDTVKINGVLKSTKAIHLFSYFGDSTVTFSFAAADTWYHLTNANDTLWNWQELDGFTVKEDTITVLESGDYDLTCHLGFDGSNGQTYSVRFYNATQGIGIPTACPNTARGSGNIISVNVSAYASGINAGDEIVLQIKNDGTGSATLKNSVIKIYLVHL